MSKSTCFVIALLLLTAGSTFAQQPETPEKFYHNYYADHGETSEYPDSFKYYGPNDLWKKWTPQQRRGRDMWLFWTAGNQKFYRRMQIFAGSLPVPMSVDFFRLLDSRNRDTRFRDVGLINEPNCEKNTEPDEYGLYLDKWLGDPLEYYPNHYYKNEHDLKKYWGEPTGILGLRKFDNPRFNKSKWDRDKYFENPGKIEPPYLIGITCAFCHISHNPLNPPADPEHPRWENLAANLGNQYFDEGGLFFGRGRLAGGDRNPIGDGSDPYKTKGLGPESLLWHYGSTQQRGTSETSRFSYDFINNPNTINGIFNLAFRPQFWEEAPNGVHQPVFHILKDGADSTGAMTALQRVYVNIGSESKYWLDHLFNPVTGRKQRPMLLDEMRLKVSAERQAELEQLYHDEIYDEPFGTDWQATEARIADMLYYLISYGPMLLKDAPGGEQHIDWEKAKQGAIVFADNCAQCHSNKQPTFYVKDEERQKFYRHLVSGDGFQYANTLTDDVRYPVTATHINSQRAMGTNAIDGDIWADVSSKDYKAQPPVGRFVVKIPFAPNQPPLEVDYTPEGGGRGYYRTASLVSLWSSAPFLHNNSIGAQPLQKREGEWEQFPDLITWETNPDAVTVEGRLVLFEDACEKLLWPEKREHHVKRAATDTGLGKGMESLELAFLKIVRRHAVDQVLDELKQVLSAKGIPETVADALLIELRPEIERLIDEAVKKKKTEAKSVTSALLSVDPLHNKFAALAQGKIEKLAEIQAEVDRVLDKLNRLDMKIPKGFPLNALFNQHVESLPYALIAFIKNSDGTPEAQRALLQELFELSRCPDVVEDRGHYYGSELTDEQKRMLIEYLKTL